ncbi:MAG: hypothetical protein EPO22_14260 [Dehalococcoidia bacterium]|nr:MAG: hypothetical protein EPO22_14260 [Dehalococcoidia bacterium]
MAATAVALSAAVTSIPDAMNAQSGASISGRVTFTDGSPAWRKPVDFVNIKDLEHGDVARTDPDGRYAITGLADGVYLVGKFDADRVPADKNPQLEDHPAQASVDVATIQRGRRVVIANRESVKDVDFVITDIGPEMVEGPDVGPGRVALPGTGVGADGDGGNAATLAAAVILLGVAILGATVLTRRGRRT